jgi:ABC-type phosphate/phosphonate transport system substrate-binding protein
MMKKITCVTLTLATLLAGAAQAAPKDFAIYVTRLGGDSQSAKPYIAKFTGYLEEALKWPTGSLKGSFHVERPDILAYIKATKPGLAVLEPPLYFELRAKEKLTPIAQLESKDLSSSKMHLVVKDPALKSLDALKGKRLWTTLAESPVYLSKVVLGGRVDAAKHFKMKRIGRADKGVRAVLRGDADVALLDDDQLANAKKMEGGDTLRSIFDSPALPALPLCTFGQSLSAKDQKALVQALLKMCGSPKGAPVCKEMRIQRISAVNLTLLKEAQKRFEAP